jgi:U32 family peptidase
MRPLVYAQSVQELELWKKAEIHDVIISSLETSRRGALSFMDSISLIHTAVEMGFSVNFEWDALMEEPRFREISQLMLKLPDGVRAIRVRDAGAALWVRDHLPQDIHLILEAGHHNLWSIRSWQLRLKDRLKQIVISSELPLKTIQVWSKEIEIPLEILALGPLLLFHSPRKLLSPLDITREEEQIFASGASVESPHKGFPLLENSHGTQMFHPKDLCILDKWSQIQSSGISFYRIDHRQENAENISSTILTFLKNPSSETLSDLRSQWSREWMRGYWDVNKSDVLFDKLTNKFLQIDENVCAEVIEGQKSKWLAIKILAHGIKLNQELGILTPLGKSRSMKIMWMKDSQFKDTSELKVGDVGFIPWCSGATSKSLLKL